MTNEMRSQSVAILTKHLTVVQQIMKSVPKDSDNPFFHSKYSDYVICVETTRRILAENGFAIMQGVEPTLGSNTVRTIEEVDKDGTIIKTIETIQGWALRTTLSHVCGEFICSLFPLVARDISSQAFGSAFSYARRYSYLGIINQTSGGDDDDGNAQALSNKRTYAKPSAKPGYYPMTPTFKAKEGTPLNEGLNLTAIADTELKAFIPNNNAAKPATEPQVYKIGSLTSQLGWDNEVAQEWLLQTTGKAARKLLTSNQASEVIGTLLKLQATMLEAPNGLTREEESMMTVGHKHMIRANLPKPVGREVTLQEEGPESFAFGANVDI